MEVFHLILRRGPVLESPFQLEGAVPCPTPLAPGPRYAGQSAADRTGSRQKHPATTEAREDIHRSVFIRSAPLCVRTSVVGLGTLVSRCCAPWYRNLQHV